MSACSPRHTSPLCRAPRIAGCRSLRRAVGALVASGSDLWLVESREALRSLAAPRLGELTEQRIADAALEWALERLVSAPGTTAAGSKGGGGPRLASSFRDRTHTLPGRALLRPLLPRPVRREASIAALPPRPTTISGGGGTG